MRLHVLALLLLPALLTAQKPPAWQMQNSGTTASLRGIYSVDGATAWASGTGGTVLKTIDGGQNWQRCATPDAGTDGATLDFRGVQAWDADTAIVMASGPGDKSRLYKTTDGCKTWRLLFKNPDQDGFWDSLRFFKEQRSLKTDEGFGLLLGDPVAGEITVYETRDGGRSWTRLHDPVLRAKGSAFAASNSCIASINATNDFILGGESGSAKLRLNYSGTYWRNDRSKFVRDWTKVSVPIDSSSASKGSFAIGTHVQILHAPSGAAGMNLKLFEVIVGGDYEHPERTEGTAAYSLDSGEHWAAAQKPPHGYRSTVQWDEQEKLWIAAGSNGSDVSRDDGRTWQKLDDGNWNALSLPFLVGPGGRIARLNAAALEEAR